jgi:radical SAM protein with 4Fe4S-binding SPASM domain
MYLYNVYQNHDILCEDLASALTEFLYDNKIRRCGAGVGILSFDTDGNIFPCMGFIGFKKYQLSSVSVFRTDNIVKSKLIENMLNNEPNKCKHCWLQVKCVSGCYVDNYYNNKDWSKLNELNCGYQFAKVEAIIYFVSLLSWEEKEKLFNRIYFNKIKSDKCDL